MEILGVQVDPCHKQARYVDVEMMLTPLLSVVSVVSVVSKVGLTEVLLAVAAVAMTVVQVKWTQNETYCGNSERCWMPVRGLHWHNAHLVGNRTNFRRSLWKITRHGIKLDMDPKA